MSVSVFNATNSFRGKRYERHPERFIAVHTVHSIIYSSVSPKSFFLAFISFSSRVDVAVLSLLVSEESGRKINS